MSERIAIFGASRGLGRALSVNLAELATVEKLFLLSRKIESYQELVRKYSSDRIAFRSIDFSDESIIVEVVNFLCENDVTKILYVAGGGPFGFFGEKKWTDHHWAFKVNFLFPCQLIHKILSEKRTAIDQLVYVGSNIAENLPEPQGASYAASKLAMKGLIKSIQAESGLKKLNGLDLRLYSPGYIDTDLLPKNASPRQNGSKIFAPREVAVDIVNWMHDDSARLTNRVFAD